MVAKYNAINCRLSERSIIVLMVKIPLIYFQIIYILLGEDIQGSYLDIISLLYLHGQLMETMEEIFHTKIMTNQI